MDQRPATVLERAIARGQEGVLDPRAVLWVLAAGPVVILNQGEPAPNEFPGAPLVLTREGQSFLAVFTHQAMTGAFFSDAYVAASVPAFEMLRRVPEGTGMVVNPGSPLGLEVPADGLRAFTLDVLNTQMP